MTSEKEHSYPQIVLILDVVAASIDRDDIFADLQRRSASCEDELVLPRTRVYADLLDGIVHVIVGLESDRSEPIERLIAKYPEMVGMATIVHADRDDRRIAEFACGLRISEWRHVRVPAGRTRMVVEGSPDDLERFARETAEPTENDLELFGLRLREFHRCIERDAIVLMHHELDVRMVAAYLASLSERYPRLTFRVDVRANDPAGPRAVGTVKGGAVIGHWTKTGHDD